MLSWISRQIRCFDTRTVCAAFVVALVLFFVFSFDTVFAQGALVPDTNVDTFGFEEVENNTLLSGDSLFIIISRVINVFFGVLGVIVVFLILYGGYLYMTAAGREDQVTRARKVIINSVIGLAIILSAFAITRFVLFALREATGLGGAGNTSSEDPPAFNDFAGTGGLGDAIRDHYPFRDATGVPRNSKIALTFNPAIDPGSLILNTNNTCWAADGTGPTTPESDIGCLQNAQGDVPYFGDCVDPQDGEPFSWEVHCDTLNPNAISLVSVTGDAQNPLISPIPAAALTVYEGDAQETFSFVFRPHEPLGSSANAILHRVSVTPNVKRASDGADVLRFMYRWEFQTGTSLDLTAPTVTRVYPQAGENDVPRNASFQIHYSEAMDPLTTAGVVGPESVFTNTLAANTTLSQTTIEGQWRVANGYRSVEFLPESACGLNSCGETIYCVELDCDPADDLCRNSFQVLARTANKRNNEDTPFEAVPFTGITDMAGNALDGGNIGVPDPKPGLADLHAIGDPDELQADNYFWNFSVRNYVDKAAPYIRQIDPGIDAQAVSRNTPIRITFDREMSASSFYNNITIHEHPAPVGVDPIWVRPILTTFSEDIGGRTVYRDQAVIEHREFGPNGVDYFYFPGILSTVKSATQNCLYPGRGPVASTKDITPSPVCEYFVNDDNEPLPGIENNGIGCVEVRINDGAQDTACLQLTHRDNPDYPLITSSTAACLTILADDDVSQGS